jgi:hypothetical protein
MFNLIRSGSSEELRSLGKGFYRSGNIPVALRCFDHVLDHSPPLDGITHPATTTSLHLFSDFMHLTCGFKLLIDADSSDDNIHKLFGFRSTDASITIVPQGSFLNKRIANAPEQPCIEITKAYLDDSYRGFLWTRVTTRLENLIRLGLAEGFIMSCYRVLAGASKHKPNLRGKFAAGVTVIGKAIQMACNDLKPIDQSYDKRFLTTFMRAISTAFAFEGDGALSLLQGVNVGGHFLGCPAAGFIDDFVSSLGGESQDSILHGIQFVKLAFIHY